MKELKPTTDIFIQTVSLSLLKASGNKTISYGCVGGKKEFNASVRTDELVTYFNRMGISEAAVVLHIFEDGCQDICIKDGDCYTELSKIPYVNAQVKSIKSNMPKPISV